MQILKGTVYARIWMRALEMDKGKITVKLYLELLGANVALWTEILIDYYQNNVAKKSGIGIAITLALCASLAFMIIAIVRDHTILAAGLGMTSVGALFLLLAWIRNRYLS